MLSLLKEIKNSLVARTTLRKGSIMASHDFCLGCPKCDKEQANSRIHAQIDKINKTIEELKSLGSSLEINGTIMKLEEKRTALFSKLEY